MTGEQGTVFLQAQLIWSTLIETPVEDIQQPYKEPLLLSKTDGLVYGAGQQHLTL